MSKTPITVAYGDGIGPEIMSATLHILKEASAELEIETIEIGEKIYAQGHPTGIPDNAWESLKRTKIFLKAPITTPQGGGYKSLNVTTRKAFGLFANIRPCVSYHPFVKTKHPQIDVVIVRENEEDLYAGIEQQQTIDVVECLKLISRPGTERIVRYAFEYAKTYKRKKVTCFTKDNIMKLTDGLFHKIFEAIGQEYPEIEKEHWIIDIGAAKLADTPEAFDVIVLPNLYGDILSDVAAQIAGSVGLAGSANIGPHYAMFEAIHGSAPKRAGQNVANPSGLLHGAIMMLVHIGQTEVAERIHNAWLKTIEDGIHTYDIFCEPISSELVGTKEFANAVVKHLGTKPSTLKPVTYQKSNMEKVMEKIVQYHRPTMKKELVGVDVYVDFPAADPLKLATIIEKINVSDLQLQMISSRGMPVWPTRHSETFCGDHYRCRFLGKQGVTVNHKAILSLLQAIEAQGLDFIKTDLLFKFDGKEAFSV